MINCNLKDFLSLLYFNKSIGIITFLCFMSSYQRVTEFCCNDNYVTTAIAADLSGSVIIFAFYRLEYLNF